MDNKRLIIPEKISPKEKTKQDELAKKLQSNPEFLKNIEILKKIIEDYNPHGDFGDLEASIQEIDSMMEDIDINEDYLSPENQEVWRQAWSELEDSLERYGRL